MIRALRERIPNLAIPTSPGDGRRLVRAASVPPRFIELTTVAVQNSAALERSGGADPDELRDLMSYAEAYMSVAVELEALARFIRHSIAVAKNRAGREALTTYALAQRLAKQPETADLAPHVREMRNPPGSQRRKAKEEEEGVTGDR